ncbi:hypothetical protein BOTNAR_0013g00450 [Botryotinia narcissicola]|uniref:Uncharacterized protein n=1 Tax=Botryotinia narcissicola TaxID=278944 RepID=A0A4Z1JJ33_9HELO|nr:hypothetical protein BOTNAR_0013g00450 [Botryotinia narcissicola]
MTSKPRLLLLKNMVSLLGPPRPNENNPLKPIIDLAPLKTPSSHTSTLHSHPLPRAYYRITNKKLINIIYADGCNTQRVESDEDGSESKNNPVKMIEKTRVEKTESDGVEDTWESESVETAFGDPDIVVVFFADGEGDRPEGYWP